MSLQRSSAVQEHVRGHQHSESTSSMGSNKENRRDTGSSAGGSRSSRQTPAVESAVTRLLVAIKQLLESLTQWSQQTITDEQVSDVYVRLGNDFNAAVAAFESYRIDMSELMSVPDDLRDVLERCLSEDATPENLEIYLPKVRAIITNLLQGLRTKQSLYRARATDRSSRSRGDARTDSTSSRRGEPVVTASETEDPRSAKTNGSLRSGRTPSAESSRNPSTRSKRSDPSGSSTRRAGNASDSERWVGGFLPSTALPDIPIPPVPQEATSARTGLPRSPSSRRGTGSSRTATPGPEIVDTDGPQTRQRPPRQPSSLSQVSRPVTETEVMEVVLPPPEPPVPVPTLAVPKETAPPEMKRYSLSDRPTPTIEIADPTPRLQPDAVDSSTPPPDTPNTPGVESSLAALKSSEALQRRASKRFSTYTFSKMTGAGGGPTLGAGRKTLAAGLILTPGDLAALTEADEDGGEVPAKPKLDGNLVRRRSSDRRRKEEPIIPVPPLPNQVDSRSTTPTPPVPPLVNGDYSKDIVTKPPTNGRPLTHVTEDTEPPPTPPTPPTATDITVFLQVLRQVKKVTMDPPQSFGALRVLFVDKFAYNPGQGNFPAIYIRDPSSGVQYELENVSEVKDKCLLSLNIEPLDQLKQHLDGQLLTLHQELRELKSSVSASRRMSFQGAAASVMAMNAAPHLASRPTERQFQTAARQITKIQTQQHHQPVALPLVPQLTGASDFSSVSPRIVADLKSQFDEVQNIRRDLGAMRQMYLDFVNSTKESLSGLKTQAGAVRQAANTKVGGARTAISTGKAKLDKRSQDILTEIEDLQDTVENLKEDVLKRYVTPQGFVLKRIKDKIAKTNTELESLQQHISVIRPAWKKTWEEELQNIVEEQQFLTHQEELIEDLIEDHKALSEVWGHVEKVISIRGASSSARMKTFRLLPPDEGHTGLSTVMLEIRGAQVDPEKRMKAIEAQQRARKLELESRGDEFEDELRGFVQGKKLKMTGGAEEVERVRQKKNEMTFKAMFSASGQPLTAMNTGNSGADGDMNGFGGPMVLPGLAIAPPQPDDETS